MMPLASPSLPFSDGFVLEEIRVGLLTKLATSRSFLRELEKVASLEWTLVSIWGNLVRAVL